MIEFYIRQLIYLCVFLCVADRRLVQIDPVESFTGESFRKCEAPYAGPAEQIGAQFEFDTVKQGVAREVLKMAEGRIVPTEITGDDNPCKYCEFRAICRYTENKRKW